MSSHDNVLTSDELVAAGLDEADANQLCAVINTLFQNLEHDGQEKVWMSIVSNALEPRHPFSVHTLVKEKVFGSQYDGIPPLWYPSKSIISNTNLFKFMCFFMTDYASELIDSDNATEQLEKLINIAVNDPEIYWTKVLQFAKIEFKVAPQRVLEHAEDADGVTWFPGSQLNIADIVLNKIRNKKDAIIWQEENVQTEELQTMSGEELRELSFRIAAAISKVHVKGSCIAVYLPMTALSVAIYLGIVLAGCVVVSIADSFAAPEVKSRLQITKSSVIFTQDVILRAGRVHSLYEKISDIEDLQCIVIPAGATSLKVELKSGDLSFDQFLACTFGQDFQPVICHPYSHTNILFSSGTTGIPKGISWTHLTPLKCGIDGMFYQDIRTSSVVCWPTNLGWMMGPWLLYASFLNEATMALYQGSPTSPEFCKFVESAKVTMLGVIPSIVRHWKHKDMKKDCDWSQIRCFSSTGEASSYDEYHWLMAQAGYVPIIEYCGGTEIGGAYITSCMLHTQTPSGFTLPVLGSKVVVLHDSSVTDIRDVCTFVGELALVPPTLGLSQMLLNKDHKKEYYMGMTRYGPYNYNLRRHGDVFEKNSQRFYFSRGRADDTMNLGGIKVSCIELEYTVMRKVSEIKEAAAVSYTYGTGGPEELALFLVLHSKDEIDLIKLKQECQNAIKAEINPLFKVSQVLLRDKLPRTSTNKITRNVLRNELKHSKL
eukprot:g3042.t1